MANRGGEQLIPRPEGAVPGPPAPWSGKVEGAGRVSLAQLRRALATRTPQGVVLEPFPIRRSAAVLVPLHDDGGEASVVLTRRPWAMRAHSGEVSFPGGVRDPGDPDLLATALREAWEEIGLASERVEVIGRLDPLETLSSGAHITPFVGVVGELGELVAAADEVDAILHVPLHELLDPDVYHQELWPPIPGMEARFPTPDGRRPMHFFRLAGDTVWGATARMLFQLLTIATGTEHR